MRLAVFGRLAVVLGVSCGTGWFDATVRAGDLLIICPAQFEAALQPLVAYKNRTHISAQILTLERIQELYPDRDGTPFVDEPEGIKWAIYRKHRDEAVRFVMLVGDCNVMPVRYTPGHLDDGDPTDVPDPVSGYTAHERIYEPSDLYYADIETATGEFESWDHDSPPNGLFGEIYRHGINWDTVDYHPDVAVGRVPATDLEEVQRYVAKVIRYEMSAAGETWFPNLLLSVSEAPGDWDAPTTTEAIAASLPTFHPTRLYDSLLPAGQVPPGVFSDGDPHANKLRAVFDEGCGFAYHHGHGSRTEWQNGCFTLADVASLKNTDRLPIIFAASCETARYCPYVPWEPYLETDGSPHGRVGRTSIGSRILPLPAPLQTNTYNPGDTIGEEFITGTDAGAIAYWGCANTGETEAMVLAREFFNAYNYTVLLGDMWSRAINSYYTYWHLSSYGHNSAGTWEDMVKFHTPERFPLFGDPSLRVGGVYPAEGDLDPPITTVKNLPPWVRSPYTVELTATDAGSGVYRTYLSTSGFSYDEQKTATLSTPASSTAHQTILFYSTDMFCNRESTRFAVVNLDNVPPTQPTLVLSGDPAALDGYDYGGIVTIRANSTDVGSGVASFHYHLLRGVNTDGGTRYHDARSGTFVATDSMQVTTAGAWRILVWAEDAAGNRSGAPASRDFFVTLMDHERLWEIGDILSGLKMLALRPKLELPFKPDEVGFYYRPPGGGWISLFRDTSGIDGWSGVWNTTLIPDGIVELQAIARADPTLLVAQTNREQIIPLMACAVRNLSPQACLFTLDENPRTVPRGQAVLHQIQFRQTTNRPLHNLEIQFPIGAFSQYDRSSVVPGQGGLIDTNGTLRWTQAMLTSNSWTVSFHAAAASNVPSGQPILAHAFFTCTEIPVLTTDDPTTQAVGDPTQFVVQSTNGEIRGRVLSSFMLEPVAHAQVTLGTNKHTTTDAAGDYAFTGLAAGAYSITASAPPLFGSANLSGLAVDGSPLRVDMFLPRLDTAPPSVYLQGSLADYVAQGTNVFRGFARDQANGSGVAQVSGAFRRLADGACWNGGSWQQTEYRFTAGGTTNWFLNMPGLSYSTQHTYALTLWATDAAQNTSSREFSTQPPRPTALRIAAQQLGAIRFAWDGAPGCHYCLQISTQPHSGDHVLRRCAATNTLLVTQWLPPGTNYCHVYSMIGNNLYSPSTEPLAFVVAPGPTLRILWRQGALWLAWPTNDSNYKLQSSESLSPAAWSLVGAPPVQVGQEWMVPAQSARPMMFFRLRQP